MLEMNLFKVHLRFIAWAKKLLVCMKINRKVCKISPRKYETSYDVFRDTAMRKLAVVSNKDFYW